MLHDCWWYALWPFTLDLCFISDALYIMYPGPYVYGALVYLCSLLVIRRDKKKAAKENYKADE